MLLVMTVEASTLNRGALMCNNADSIRKLVRLDQQGKSTDFMNYYSSMVQRGVCSTTIATMNPDNLGRRDLSGGVTQIGSIFVVTGDIR